MGIEHSIFLPKELLGRAQEPVDGHDASRTSFREELTERSLGSCSFRRSERRLVGAFSWMSAVLYLTFRFSRLSTILRLKPLFRYFDLSSFNFLPYFSFLQTPSDQNTVVSVLEK